MSCENLNIRQLRLLALNLQDKVNELYGAIAAIHQVSSVWNLQDVDALLPEACEVSQAIEAYKLLSIVQVSSISSYLSDVSTCCSGVIGTSDIIPITIPQPKASFVRQTSGPVMAGELLDNDLVIGQAFELLYAVLHVANTGTGGADYLQDIHVNGVSILAARPPIIANSGPQTRTYSGLLTSTFTATDVFSFPVDSAPDGCEDVTLTLWGVLL